ncbi:MAG TPA: hypothetical protein VIL34_11695 [Actinopolymorphaceae bacterium]
MKDQEAQGTHRVESEDVNREPSAAAGDGREQTTNESAGAGSGEAQRAGATGGDAARTRRGLSSYEMHVGVGRPYPHVLLPGSAWPNEVTRDDDSGRSTGPPAESAATTLPQPSAPPEQEAPSFEAQRHPDTDGDATSDGDRADRGSARDETSTASASPTEQASTGSTEAQGMGGHSNGESTGAYWTPRPPDRSADESGSTSQAGSPLPNQPSSRVGQSYSIGIGTPRPEALRQSSQLPPVPPQPAPASAQPQPAASPAAASGPTAHQPDVPPPPVTTHQPAAPQPAQHPTAPHQTPPPPAAPHQTAAQPTPVQHSGFSPPGRAAPPVSPPPTSASYSEPALYDADEDSFVQQLGSGRQRPVPRHGVRGLVYRLTHINLGLGKRDREEWEVRQRLNRQLRRTRGYCGYIGIASEKGGVGKTTLCALLAAEIAEGRRESVGVADLNPDLGTLPDRFGVRPQYSIRDLLAHVDEIPWRYHVHDFMEKVPEMNVRVLAASTDRKIRHQLSIADVELLAELFAPFFSFAILDNGTHITHEAMLGTLRVAHGMVLVTDNTKDGANLARKTLQFLTDNGFPEMRRRVVLAVVAKETASPVKVRAIERAFAEHVRELVVIPYDPALDGGGKIPFRDPNAVNKLVRRETRDAVRKLAAIVVDDLVA